MKLYMAVNRGRGRLVLCCPTFGAQPACSTRLFWSDTIVVCANALAKSALGTDTCRKRMLKLDVLARACRCTQ